MKINLLPRIVEKTCLVFSGKGIDGMVCDVLYLNALYVKHIRKKKCRLASSRFNPPPKIKTF